MTTQVELGRRLCEYVKSIGCRVEWKTAHPHMLYLAVIAADNTYSGWESLNYVDNKRGKSKAYREFSRFVIKTKPESLDANWDGLPIIDVLVHVIPASSAEELDLRLSVLGF